MELSEKGIIKSTPYVNDFIIDIHGIYLDITEPIVITPDKVIVSGHQRVRACKELGIDEINCDIHLYNNEDEILQDFLETNIRQRGEIGGSAKKVGKRIKELERLYGIREGSAGGNGSNQYVKKELQPKKQKNLNQILRRKWEFQLILFRTINFFQK